VAHGPRATGRPPPTADRARPGRERTTVSPVDAAGIRDFLARIVAVPSVNPALAGGHGEIAGEARLAGVVAGELDALGLEVTTREPEPGRTSVVGTLPGRGGGPSLLLYAHLDTVGVEGMEDPFGAVVREGRLFGRGAYDMKGGLAACVGAARALVGRGKPLDGDLHLAFVADEETESLGMRDLLGHLRPDAAVVTEPTDLRLCLAHKGFAWIEVETSGRASHGSRFEEGVDANLRMGRVLARLEELERDLRTRPGHPLVGPPSLHAATLEGGTGPSTYADRCRLVVERRTVPGETRDAVLAEIRGILDALSGEDPDFEASLELLLWRSPFEADPDSRLAELTLREAGEVLGDPPPVGGETYWMDAAFLAEAGVDTVVLGPRGAGAHAAEEWVDLASVVRLAEILEGVAGAYCGGA